MESFKNFITEGRDAPLYHGTSEIAAHHIIRDNCIKAETQHPSMYSFVNDTRFSRNEYGISLSRSLETAMAWRDAVVFEIDQRKLVQTHKVYPINVGAGWFNQNGTRSAKFEQLFEERVVGDIKPLDRYLLRIWVLSEELLHRTLEKRPVALANITNHPLSYCYTTGKKLKPFIAT